jgi:outer membrane protein assembly factor BamB
MTSRNAALILHPLWGLRCVAWGLALVLTVASGAGAQDAAGAQNAAGADPQPVGEWPQFLGPHRNGISDETGLIDEWPAGGPKEVWRVKGGVGMSGLVVSRGRVITMLQEEGQQFVVAHDTVSGKPLWRSGVNAAYENTMGDGPRGTPAIDGDRVYVFTGDGVLAALGFADGHVIWRHDTVKELGGQVADYGMACSPLVVAGRVIVTVGAPGATVAAYDCETGKLAWKSGRDSAGYSSPARLRLGGRDQVVVFSGQSALGLAPDTGESLWRYPYKTNFDCNIATPVQCGGNVFISSGENHGCTMLTLTPAGAGFDVKPAWESLGAGSVMRNGWPTCILWKGRLYGLDNVGAASALTHLTCIDAATGERLWQKTRFGNGNLIAADGKLILTTMKGELVFVRLSPKGYEEIGRSVVIGKTRQGPALADGRLYLRDDREIVCVDVRKD